MANKSLKTIKFPGLDDTYTIPQSYSDVGAASVAHTHSYSDVGAASAAHTHTYSQVGAASAAHTHTAADVGAVPTSRTVNGKSLNANITLSASDVGALPTSTHIPADQVNADWTATTGVTSILNKPSIPAAQVNANWSATTGVASILNKPSIPSTYSDVGAASAAHTHTYSDVGAMSAGTQVVHSVTVSPDFSSGQKIAEITVDSTTASIYAPEGTVQVNADWNASTGVSSILNKPSIPAAQVNSDWNASTGLSSILNKPSIPSTYSDVGAASASHGHGNISNDGKIADTGFLPGTSLTLIAADSTGTIALGPSITGSTGDANKYLSDKGTFETVPAAQVNANWTATTGVSSILNKPTIPAAQVNSNWTATTGVSSILNKPSSMTPTAHASTATTYGQGTSSKYGHVKLSDSISSTSSAASGIAATPSAVKAAYDLADTANGKATTAGNLAQAAQGAASTAQSAAETAQDSATNALDKLGTQTNIEVTVATGATSVLNFSSTTGTRGVLFFNGYSLNTKGAYIVTCATNGTVQAQPILAASDLALTTGTRKLTIKNNSTASGAYGIFMRFAGSFTIS